MIEIANRVDDGEVAVPLSLIAGYGDYERLLSLESAYEIPAIALCAEVGIIYRHIIAELSHLVAIRHGLHDFVFEFSDSCVPDPKLGLILRAGTLVLLHVSR